MINMTVSISSSCLILASKWNGRQNGKEGKKCGGVKNDSPDEVEDGEKM